MRVVSNEALLAFYGPHPALRAFLSRSASGRGSESEGQAASDPTRGEQVYFKRSDIASAVKIYQIVLGRVASGTQTEGEINPNLAAAVLCSRRRNGQRFVSGGRPPPWPCWIKPIGRCGRAVKDTLHSSFHRTVAPERSPAGTLCSFGCRRLPGFIKG